MSTRARYEAGGSGVYQFTPERSDGTAATGSNLTALTLTLRNARDGTTVHLHTGSDDVFGVGAGAGDVTRDPTSGLITWQIRPEDTAMVDATLASEFHRAEWKFTMLLGSVVETGYLVHDLICVPRNRLTLCDTADVLEALGIKAVSDEEAAAIESAIDVVSEAAETLSDRWFRYKVDEVEEFSSWGDGVSTLWLRRYPIVSVTWLKESYDSDFTDPPAGHASTVGSSDYVALAEVGAIRMRYRRAITGDRVIQAKYTGGKWREVAAVDWLARDAAARQAAYMLNRRGAQLGVSGANQGEGGGVTFMERDLLESFKRVFGNPPYRRLHPVVV